MSAANGVRSVYTAEGSRSAPSLAARLPARDPRPVGKWATGPRHWRDHGEPSARMAGATKNRSHFAYRIDAWDADGENVIEHLAGVEDLPAEDYVGRLSKSRARPLRAALRCGSFCHRISRRPRSCGRALLSTSRLAPVS